MIRLHRYLFASLLLGALTLAACKGGGGSVVEGAEAGPEGDPVVHKPAPDPPDDDASSPLCTPGDYVFCRCADRTEGTKKCNDDGQSFQACTCLDGG